jgi:hypothetical protein
MRHCVVLALLASCVFTASAQEQPAKKKKELAIPVEGPLTPNLIKDLPECSVARVNGTCKFSINRNSPMVPSTPIQMYSGRRLVAIVRNVKPFERYFLDPVSGQFTQIADTSAAIIQGMIPALGKLNLDKQVMGYKAQILHGFDQNKQPPPTTKQLCNAVQPSNPVKKGDASDEFLLGTKLCLAALSVDAKKIYGELEPYTSPDAIVANPPNTVMLLKTIDSEMEQFIDTESGLTSRITAVSGSTDIKNDPDEQQTLVELSLLQKPADAIAADLVGYRTRIADLATYSNGSDSCDAFSKYLTAREHCVAVTSNTDDDAPYGSMVARTATYTVDTYNLVSYSQEAAPDASKKKTLGGNIAINFADGPFIVASPALRWEASAGVFFSSLPIRSFSVAPKFDGTNVTDNTVIQTILRPTVVPYAAGNYRLTNDLHWSKWKSNVYLTGAVGVNPNTVSADFAAGLSLSWRSLMLSPLWHYGHDTRLVGFTVGESLGAAFKSTLPTETFWTSSFAIGIGIRIPPIIGR